MTRFLSIRAVLPAPDECPSETKIVPFGATRMSFGWKK